MHRSKDVRVVIHHQNTVVNTALELTFMLETVLEACVGNLVSLDTENIYSPYLVRESKDRETHRSTLSRFIPLFFILLFILISSPSLTLCWLPFMKGSEVSFLATKRHPCIHTMYLFYSPFTLLSLHSPETRAPYLDFVSLYFSLPLLLRLWMSSGQY